MELFSYIFTYDDVNVSYMQLKIQCLGTKSKSRYLVILIVSQVILGLR